MWPGFSLLVASLFPKYTSKFVLKFFLIFRKNTEKWKQNVFSFYRKVVSLKLLRKDNERAFSKTEQNLQKLHENLKEFIRFYLD